LSNADKKQGLSIILFLTSIGQKSGLKVQVKKRLSERDLVPLGLTAPKKGTNE